MPGVCKGLIDNTLYPHACKQKPRSHLLAPQTKLIIVPYKIPYPLIPRIVDHSGYAGSPGFIEHQHTILKSSLNGRPLFDFIATTSYHSLFSSVSRTAIILPRRTR
jgi:hypothetical protein